MLLKGYWIIFYDSGKEKIIGIENRLGFGGSITTKEKHEGIWGMMELFYIMSVVVGAWLYIVKIHWTVLPQRVNLSYENFKMKGYLTAHKITVMLDNQA